MANVQYSTNDVPFNDELIDMRRLLTRPWQVFFRYLMEAVDPLGVEKVTDLINNQSISTDVTGMNVNSAQVSHAVVEYLIQRVTTSAGATEIINGGTFHLVYKPTADTWEIQGQRNPGAGTFTAATTDICTKIAHNMLLGQQVQVTTTTTLPAGLSLATTYWVIPLSEDTFKLAASFADSQAGTAIDITSTGAGTHTINPNPGVVFSVTSDGQVQYTTTNISGTASISKIFFRMRTMGGKNSQYSAVSTR